ncbi:Leucine Rich repeat [Phytophthora infestans]|uniref:Leucine Rich repeat n=1 Tax=Phytophthora infestans TaxID=4787 RepID=A0A8S9UX18_PHYIN|nr:Leucine Rich repeat [Phytophthora infestans]
MQTLSLLETQLIHAYDLSRLDVFEVQAYLQTIDRWCAKVERSKRRQFVTASKRVDRTMKRFLHYVLLPVNENQPHEPYCELAAAIGFVTPPTLQLRPSIPSKRRRKKWVHVPIEGQDAADVQEEGASPPKFRIQSEIVCFRLPIASVGCGIIADKLQHSSSIVKLRLNHCQITDAGAILLAIMTRQLLEMKRWTTRSVPRAIALALVENRSVKQVDLSRNPVGSRGAIALASMLQTNVTLERICLDRTLVQDGAQSLIDAFQASKSLNILSMLWCSLRPEVGAKLASVQAAKNVQ